MSGLLFVALNLLAVTAAYQFATVLLSRCDASRRVLGTLAGFPIVTQAVLLTLGSLGHLSRLNVFWMLAALVAVATLVRLTLCKPRPAVVMDPPAAPDRGDASMLLTLAVFGLAAFIGLWTNQTLLGGTDYRWDDLMYHASPVAQWLRDGQLSLPHTGKYAYYPMTADLFALWFALPFGEDSLAGYAACFWVTVASVSIACLVRQQGGSRGGALVGVTLVLASPVVLTATKTFSGVDLAGPAMVLAAIALANPPRSRAVRDLPSGEPLPGLPAASRGDGVGPVLLLGALVGYAIGCKVNVVPEAIVVLAWCVLAMGKSLKDRFRLAVAGAAAMVFTGGYWYAQNLLLTGNPLYPAQLGPFPGPQTSQQLAETQLITWLLHRHLSLQQWMELVKQHVNFPPALLLLAAAGYVGMIYRWLGGRRSRDSAVASASLLLLICGTMFLVLYPLMPYSGTNEDFVLRVHRRFLIGPYWIGLALFCPLLGSFSRHREAWIGYTFLAVLSGALAMDRQSMSFSTDALAVAVAGLVVVAVAWLRAFVQPRFHGQPLPIAARRGGGWLLLVAGLCALAALQPLRVQRTAKNLYRWDGPDRPVGIGWKALEMLPDGSRIALFARAGPTYPYYGRALRYVPVSHGADGTLLSAANHEEFFAAQRGVVAPREGPLTNLIENLVFSRVDYVFVSKWDGKDWPPQRAVLKGSDRACRIYGDGYSEIWKIEAKGKQPTGTVPCAVSHTAPS